MDSCLPISCPGKNVRAANGERPGFDQNGQVASGFAVKEGGDGPPKFSPVFYLVDLMTGYFVAAGMMSGGPRL